MAYCLHLSAIIGVGSLLYIYDRVIGVGCLWPLMGGCSAIYFIIIGMGIASLYFFFFYLDIVCRGTKLPTPIDTGIMLFRIVWEQRLLVVYT